MWPESSFLAIVAGVSQQYLAECNDVEQWQYLHEKRAVATSERKGHSDACGDPYLNDEVAQELVQITLRRVRAWAGLIAMHIGKISCNSRAKTYSPS